MRVVCEKRWLCVGKGCVGIGGVRGGVEGGEGWEEGVWLRWGGRVEGCGGWFRGVWERGGVKRTGRGWVE